MCKNKNRKCVDVSTAPSVPVSPDWAMWRGNDITNTYSLSASSACQDGPRVKTACGTKVLSHYVPQTSIHPSIQPASRSHKCTAGEQECYRGGGERGREGGKEVELERWRDGKGEEVRGRNWQGEEERQRGEGEGCSH